MNGKYVLLINNSNFNVCATDIPTEDAHQAIEALRSHGFVVDPGGIRAMGLRLQA